MHVSMPRRHTQLSFRSAISLLMLTILSVTCSMSGCANLGAATSTTTAVPTNTINDQTALAYDAVTFASTTVNALLRAGQMTLDAHKQWQAKLSATYVAIGTATTVAQLQALRAQANQVTTSNGGTPPAPMTP